MPPEPPVPPLPVPPEPLVPPLFVVVGVDVLPPHDTSPAARTMVNVSTRNPRIKTGAPACCRRTSTNMNEMRQIPNSTIVHAALPPYTGPARDGGAEISIDVAGGADFRVTVHVVEVPVAVFSELGLKLLQSSQLGAAPPVSASMQLNVIDPLTLPPGVNVTLKVAVGLAADKFAESGVIEAPASMAAVIL